MYDHSPLTLPITEAQKTKATEPARLSVSRQAIFNAIFAIDNIKGTDIQTTALMHVAQQLRIMRDGMLQRASREQLPVDELTKDAASRADESERDERTRQYMFERDARQEERRGQHPTLAKIIDRQTLTDVEEAPTRPLPKITHHFTLEEIHVASVESAGFCIACGAYKDSCEPDARNYRCDECGELQVFGANEIVLMGLVD